MKLYNLMTGGGFEGGAYGMPWISAWLALAIVSVICYLGYLFFVKEEYSPWPYNFAGSLVGPLLTILVITFTGFHKIAFIVGILGLIGGGFLLGRYVQ